MNAQGYSKNIRRELSSLNLPSKKGWRGLRRREELTEQIIKISYTLNS